MTLPIHRLDDEFATAPQVLPEQMQEIARAGFRTVIDNRPDGEGGADQPSSAALRAAAEKAGLRFAYLPVDPANIRREDLAAFRSELDAAPKPALGFCRTGMRAAKLYRGEHK